MTDITAAQSRTEAPVRLSVSGLAKSYSTKAGPVQIIADLTFDVRAGEIACIVGPSGIGKTTLLKCLAGLQPLTAGTAAIDGEVIDGPPRDLALVFQEYTRSLMPWLTVERNVAMPLKHLRLPRAERAERIAGALTAVGLSGSETKYPWQLSGGMQQRVAIARAIAYRPDVLIMDEPFASVDAQTRFDLEDLCLKIRAEFGMTIVVVTHDIDEAVYLSDRVIVLGERPAKVTEILDVTFPEPRDQIVTRSEPLFAELRSEILAQIRKAHSMGPEARGYDTFRGRVDEFASASVPSWPAMPDATGPNVIVMLIDDLGFSDLGPFGSEIDTPHIDGLAADGWVFTNYHTAPMCSPSRAALMTGLNPHRAGFGYVAHVDPGYPGFACELPDDAPTIAETLRAGGYATFMVGKWHLTVESKLHDAADKSSWPLQRGFDRYFGSMDGFTSLHRPHRLVSDNSVVDVPEFPEDYFLTDDLTERAIGMIDDLRANDPDKPFFLYYAHTSVHGPIQAKAADIAKYRGRYEAGWNRLREERFARQCATGVIDASAALPADDMPDAAAIRPWDDLSPADQALFARHMEAYAAAVDEIDQSVGRLLARLAELGERDDTIVIVTSDNGGTAEGGPSGTRSYFAQFGLGTPLPDGWVADVPRDPDLIGGPRLFSQYPAGWARVSNTPFRAFKSTTYEGGVHAPLVVSWPHAPISAVRGIRRQFAFVSDLAPTILELTGIPPLRARAGVPAVDVDGQSFAAALTDPAAPSRELQYFECVGARALYREGMKAIAPVAPRKSEGAAGGSWELYDLRLDPTETRDLARRHPRVVHELAERWRSEAWRNTVFPLDDDGSLHTVRPASEAMLSVPVTLTAFRPPLERFRSSRLTVLRSFRIEIALHTAADTAGVIVAHGDQGGGYLVAIEDGRLLLSYNAYGAMHRSSTPLPQGRRTVTIEVDEQPDLRWSLTAIVDGAPATRLDSVPMLLGMAPFTGISVGYDYGSPVDWELAERHGAYRIDAGAIESLRYVPGARSPYDGTVLRAIDDAVARVAD